jgi:uncharacterized RDD family membrane protein YckC
MIRHEVLTTEKVPFSFRVAGMGSRFMAWLIDASALVVLYFAGVLAGSVLEIGRAGLGMAIVVLWLFMLQWGYFLLFEWLWHGQTPGKWLVGIRVLDLRGTAITFYRSAVRNFLRAVDALPLPLPFWCGLLGLATAAANRENRRLGDLSAGTLVVHVERRPAPLRTLHEAATDLDKARLALVRQRLAQLDRQRKQAVLDLCLRREQLRAAERSRLFQAVGQYLQRRLDIEPEPYESPEKFVLRLAAVLGEWTVEGPR